MIETMKTLQIEMRKEQEKAIECQERIIRIVKDEKAPYMEIQWEMNELQRLKDWMATSQQANELKIKEMQASYNKQDGNATNY